MDGAHPMTLHCNCWCVSRGCQSGDGASLGKESSQVTTSRPLSAARAGPTSGIMMNASDTWSACCVAHYRPHEGLSRTDLFAGAAVPSDFHSLLFEIDFIQALCGGAARLSGLPLRQLRCKTGQSIDPSCSFIALYKDCSVVILLLCFWFQIKKVEKHSQEFTSLLRHNSPPNKFNQAAPHCTHAYQSLEYVRSIYDSLGDWSKCQNVPLSRLVPTFMGSLFACVPSFHQKSVWILASSEVEHRFMLGSTNWVLYQINLQWIKHN